MITNISIVYTDKTDIRWEYNGNPCHFINDRITPYQDIIDWIKSMPEEDQREHFVQPRLDIMACLGIVLAHGRKISLIS